MKKRFVQVTLEERKKLENPELQEHSVFGIHEATFTGEYLEEDALYFKVKLVNGISFFAPIKFTFPVFFAPSVEWMETYANSLIAMVQFMYGNPRKPIITGVRFKEGAEHNLENFPRRGVILTEVFEMFFDDENNHFKLGQIEGQSFEFKEDATIVTTEKGFLGAEDAEEPAVLGNKLKEFKESFIDELGKVAGLATPAGPSGALSTAPNWAAFATAMKQKLDSFLSTDWKIKK